MLKKIKTGFTLTVIALISFIATPAFGRAMNLKEAGTALWGFLIIGAIIILLQLIPALILFFSFIGTATGLIAKKKTPEKAIEEKRVVLSGYEPAPVKR